MLLSFTPPAEDYPPDSTFRTARHCFESYVLYGFSPGQIATITGCKASVIGASIRSQKPRTDLPRRLTKSEYHNAIITAGYPVFAYRDAPPATAAAIARITQETAADLAKYLEVCERLNLPHSDVDAKLEHLNRVGQAIVSQQPPAAALA